MKNLFFLVAILSLALSMINCKSKKETTNSSSNTTAKVDASVTKYDLIVSFISKGTGVDRDKYAAFVKYIESHPDKPVYERIAWGREGESDYCFNLSTLKKANRSNFITEIKNQMKGSNMVFITENAECTHQKRN